ncbi:unnamed protein product [Thelazia callipaeda]|uniref:Pyroglutamyl-peptidase 1 n=1 Tax=Thelazia callipaeda TaxID=103827 RepID=A0A0N5D8R7_THECL|nr:unnamed protein product [Thelazia callipaeda]
MEQPELLIVLTGFGPFQSCTDNPSEALVRKIAKEGISDVLPNARVIGEVISVAYDDVDNAISELWQKHRPDFVIHLGYHAEDRCIKIEKKSCGIGYVLCDVKEKTPQNYRCPLAGCSNREEENTIFCGLDCQKLLRAVQTIFVGKNVQFELSCDPGRYLCAYSYYISLRHNKDCCLFVHIPSFDDVCTVDLVASVIKQIIVLSMQQILEKREKQNFALETGDKCSLFGI